MKSKKISKSNKKLLKSIKINLLGVWYSPEPIGIYGSCRVMAAKIKQDKLPVSVVEEIINSLKPKPSGNKFAKEFTLSYNTALDKMISIIKDVGKINGNEITLKDIKDLVLITYKHYKNKLTNESNN